MLNTTVSHCGNVAPVIGSRAPVLESRGTTKGCSFAIAFASSTPHAFAVEGRDVQCWARACFPTPLARHGRPCKSTSSDLVSSLPSEESLAVFFENDPETSSFVLLPHAAAVSESVSD